jgi:ABC-type dipeptide/oligopeptide/nickel transport system permease subunit
MSATAPLTFSTAAPLARPSGVFARIFARWPARIAGVLVAMFVLAGITPLFSSTNGPAAWAEMPALGTITDYAAPSLSKVDLWMGTNIAGKPVLWRIVCGAGIALKLAVGATAVTLLIGVTLGVLAGYFGGWIDAAVIWLVSTMSSIPWVLLILAMIYALRGVEVPQLMSVVGADGVARWHWQRATLGPLPIIILALGLTDWVGLCRLVRGQTLQLRSLDYVSAATAMGASTPRIIVRHILPGVWHLVIITFSLSSIAYVQAEVVLSFLGLGVTGEPSWGRMIDDAKLELLRGVWWQFAAATAAVGLLCLALNVLGDALRDALDVRR